MKTFDLYEFVGLIVPGTLLLLAYGVLFGAGSPDLPIPGNIGGLGVYLMIAYALGHLIQALGYLVETIYWKCWGGKPTDWPLTRPSWRGAPRALASIAGATGHTLPRSSDVREQLPLWQSLVGEARANLYASGRAARLQVFNANYGLFRGILAALSAIASVAWMSEAVSLGVFYLGLIVTAVLAERRMHHFAIHYAKELFVNAAAIRLPDFGGGQSDPGECQTENQESWEG